MKRTATRFTSEKKKMNSRRNYSNTIKLKEKKLFKLKRNTFQIIKTNFQTIHRQKKLKWKNLNLSY